MSAFRTPCLAALLLLAACAAPGWEWSSYAADPASTRFAPLSQIDGGNFHQLREAWRYTAPDKAIAAAEGLGTYANKGSPLVADGVLYYGSPFNVLCAVDPATGEELWTFDPRAWEAEWLQGHLPRSRILAQRPGEAAVLRHRQRPPLLHRRRDRPTRHGLRRGRLRRPGRGPAAAHRPRALLRHLAAHRLPRRGGGRRRHRRLARRAPRGVLHPGRRARLRRPHRRAAVGLPHGAAGGRGRQRDLGERRLAELRAGQRVVGHERRRGAGLRLPADERGHAQLLWRRPPRGQPLQPEPGLRQGRHRGARLALPVRCTTACGTTTCRRRPCWPTSRSTDARSRPWPK